MEKELDKEAMVEECLRRFPGILHTFERTDLDDAVEDGVYIFYEDFFNEFIERFQSDQDTMQRAGVYIEHLANSKNADVINLVEIGIIEGLINRGVDAIEPFFGAKSRELVAGVLSHFDVDKARWTASVLTPKLDAARDCKKFPGNRN